jgi:hypothetical protein
MYLVFVEFIESAIKIESNNRVDKAKQKSFKLKDN